LTEEAFLRNWI